MSKKETIGSGLVVTKTLIAQADEIASAHEHFTTHYVVGGRVALYELLGRMLAVVRQFDQAEDREELIAKIKHRLRTEFGIKTQANSSDTAVLIRYMTRTDRKTTHVYARALEAAMVKAIEPARLPLFIEQHGGIEKIRADGVGETAHADAIDPVAERIALAYEYLSCRTELPLASFRASEAIDRDGNSGSAFDFFVCTRGADGQFHILSRLPCSTDFERVAIRHLSNEIGSDIERARQAIGMLRTKAKRSRETRLLNAQQNAKNCPNRSTTLNLNNAEVV